jgi:hypothetical protein
MEKQTVHRSEKVEEKRRISNTQNVILSGFFIPESPDLNPVHREPTPVQPGFCEEVQ